MVDINVTRLVLLGKSYCLAGYVRIGFVKLLAGPASSFAHDDFERCLAILVVSKSAHYLHLPFNESDLLGLYFTSNDIWRG